MKAKNWSSGRTMVAAVLTLVLAAVAGGCGGGGGSGGETYDLSIGYIPDVHSGGIIAVADDRGFWEEAGVRPDVRKFTDGPTQIQAMASGSIDIAYLGPGATWLPATGQGGEVVTLDSLNTGDVVIGGPGVQTLEDLKGKRVGTPVGTSGEMILNLALGEAGLTEKDVEVVNMRPDTVVQAMTSGQIDAGALYPPGSVQILDRVPEARELISGGDFNPEITFPQFWVASDRILEEDPEAVRAFLEAFALANDYRAKHVNETVTLTSEFAGVPEEGLKVQADTTQWLTTQEIVEANKSGDTSEWFTGLQGVLVDTGMLEESVPPAEFVNTELLDEVAGGKAGGGS